MRSQVANGRQQFVRATVEKSLTPKGTIVKVLGSAQGHGGVRVPSDAEMKLIVEQAKTCKHPREFLACTVSNYAAAAHGAATATLGGAVDCSKYCK